MPTSLRILLAILAGAAGLSAIYVIQKPESMAGERALALGSVTTLMAVTLLSTVWERMRAAREAPEAAEAGPPPASP
ncbi:hypothetical protein, partial [Aestuariivirga sp.]|uniref:hypothetical protein n=1 Tax=Aestuariivirga sp. TaxID=2650926 RepID=UPI00391D8324